MFFYLFACLVSRSVKLKVCNVQDHCVYLLLLYKKRTTERQLHAQIKLPGGIEMYK